MIKEKVFNPSITPNHNLILDSVSDSILAIDENFNIVYANRSFKERFELFIGEKLEVNRALDSYSGVSRFAEFSSEWNYWLERCFTNEKFQEKIKYQLSGKTFHYKLNFTPVKKEDQVQYIQINFSDETIKNQYEDLLKDKKIVTENSDYNTHQNTEKEALAKERDDAVNLLFENAERIQIVLDGSSDGFWDWNIEKNDLFYSKRFYQIFGYRNGELKTDMQTWESRIHKDDVDFVIESLHAHLEGKTENFNCEYRILTKDEKWKWVHDKGKVAIRDENNNPLRIAGTLSDIDVRKTTEKYLQESEEVFSYMAENLPVMIWLTDRKIKPTFVNTKALNFIGTANGNQALQEYVHEDDLDYFKDNLRNVIWKKETHTLEIRLKNSGGEFRWILTNIVPRVSEEGKFIGILGVGLDITDRKEIETRLMESETQFNEITSVIGDGIFMVDSDWKLQFANPEFTKLLGYSQDELEGKPIHNLIHDHGESEDSNCPLKKVFVHGEIIRVSEDYFVSKDQNLVPVSYVLSPIKRNGEITGCVAAFHDITERLTSQEEMNRFVEELQFNKELMEENANEFARLNEMLGESESRLTELNASKDKFFSIISHDLRSPFTSIIGFAEVMLEDINTLSQEEIKEFTNSIYKSSKNIQNLLENLLQWSRVQTGRIELNPINFDLNSLINDVIALYHVNAARKKISLVNKVENQYYVKADKFMIDTLLRNLVSNSIKFTNQGGEIKIIVDDSLEGRLLVTISDNGVGINEETIEKLFKIDSHVTTKGTEKEKGTGLGLILCKEFVEKNNGKIWVESKIGKGSDFKFTLPYSAEK